MINVDYDVRDCYTKLLNDLLDFEEVFNGKTAKWAEKCGSVAKDSMAINLGTLVSTTSYSLFSEVCYTNPAY